MGDGSLPPEQVERLDAIAGWMADHGDSILDTEPGLAPWQFYGPSTRKGSRVFLHLLLRPYDTVAVRGVPIRRIRGIRDVKHGTALQHRTRCSVIDGLFNADPTGELTIVVPEKILDPLATVIEIDFADGPL
jgi:alpha-L-fucosidase